MSRQSLERTLPHNVDAEKSVLGAILVNNENYYRIVENLRPEDFYLDAHRVIYRHMMELIERSKAIDLITIQDELVRASHLESAGGITYLAGLLDGIPHLLVPAGLPPRAALGYLFLIPYVILRKLTALPLNSSEFQEMVKTLEALRERVIGPDVPVSKNLSKQIALRLKGKIPAVHGGVQHLEAVVMRWRTQLAENAKQLSWSHLYPELNHNEIVGWSEPKHLLRHLLILLLRDAGDHPRVQKRMEITKALLRRESGVETREVWSTGQGRLARLFSLIYTGDFVSFYLALLNRVDPTPVERITRLKKQLTHR